MNRIAPSLLVLTLLSSTALAQSVTPQAAGVCSQVGTFAANYDSSSPPEGNMLVCDGANWVVLAEYNSDQSVVFLNTVSGVTPTADAHLTTKLYVDSAITTGGIWTDNTTHVTREGFHIINTGEALPATFDDDGVRAFFYVDKEAFRGGEITGANDAWTDANIGTHSFAWGRDVEAKGLGSVATGSNNTSSGYTSVAMGSNNTSSGYTSVAMGKNNTVSSDNYGVAMGYNNTVSNYYGGTAIGRTNTASGENSVAMGSNNTASGTSSVAMGGSNTSSGSYSVAMGRGNTASASGSYASFAMGGANTSSGGYSVAMGRRNTASGIEAFALGSEVTAGSGTAADGAGDGAFAFGLQTANQTTDPKVTGDRSAVFFMDGGTANSNSTMDITASDTLAVVGGQFMISETEVDGAAAGCIQFNATTDALEFTDNCATPTWTAFSDIGSVWTDNTTHISYEGFHVLNAGQALPATFDDAGTRAFFYVDKEAFRGGEITGANDAWQDANIGTHSFAWGLDVEASNNFSVAMGTNSTASGNSSVAMGTGSTASGDASLAMGSYADASGTYSVAMGGGYGYAVVASGENSVAMGKGTTAGPGNYSFAMGNTSTATAIGATAFGNSDATGDYSFAAGRSNTASGRSSVALGGSSVLGGNTVSGYYGFAVGSNNSATQMHGVAMGQGNTASGANGSVAIGAYNTASGENSIAMGGYGNTASGIRSVALGAQVEAEGGASMAFGLQTNDPATNPKVTGDRTAAFFMSTANSAMDITAADTLAVVGGQFMISETQADGAAAGCIQFNATTDALEFTDNCATPTWTAFSDIGSVWTDNTTHISYEGFHVLNAGEALPATFDDAGTRAFFYVDKEAFRGGEITGSNDAWADANIGTHSFAWGRNVEAKGVGSVAMGFGNTASGTSVAMGFGNTASGSSSVAMGESNIASGDYSSVAMGRYSAASGYTSFAMGYNSRASGNYGVAIGSSSTASGFSSVAMGSDNTASGYYSVAMGNSSTATANGAVAFGNSDATGNYSVAMGNGATASSSSSIAMGSSAASGDNSIAMGYGNTASNGGSLAIGGRYSTASGPYSVAMGVGNTASGYLAFSVGVDSTASGYASVGMGISNTASGIGSVAIGRNNKASGIEAFALGSEVTAGSGTAADGAGDGAFAFGLQTAAQTTDPKVTGDRSAVFFMDGNTANANSTMDITASDTLAIVGGQFMISETQADGAAAGCIQFNATDNELEFTDNCATPTWTAFSDIGSVWTDNTTHISYEGFHVLNAGQALPATFDDAGTRAFFYVDKEAFRGGEIAGSNDAWTDANIGTHSFAWGLNVEASGRRSVAMGNSSTASAHYGFAMGDDANATGIYGSVAMGYAITSSGIRSFAVGAYSTASGNYSAVMGQGNTASGNYSVAMGNGSTATATGATAFGNADATGNYAFAAGDDVTASGNFSVAMGNDSTASGLFSVAMGNGSTASDSSVAMGSANASGGSSVAMGNADASGNSSVALGGGVFGRSVATGIYSFAVGYGSLASSSGSVALSGGQATGGYAFAMGYNSEAIGSYSVAMGKDNAATEFYSIAIGNSNTAGGGSSVSMGANNTASGYSSVAMGGNNTASGQYSVAIGGGATGYGNTASNYSSIAIGREVTASGSNSMAFGAHSPLASPSIVSAQGSVGFFLGGGGGGIDVTTGNAFVIHGGNVGIGNIAPDVELDVTGDIEYTGTLTDVSDIRLKTDIITLTPQDNMLGKVREIDTYSFRMKDAVENLGDDAPYEYGVMAQDIEVDFPTLVKTASDEIGTKSVNYIGFIAPIIEAIKSLAGQSDTLRADVDVLKGYNLNNLPRYTSPPIGSGDDCTKGDQAFDNSYGYMCVDTNTWKRWALDSW